MLAFYVINLRNLLALAYCMYCFFFVVPLDVYTSRLGHYTIAMLCYFLWKVMTSSVACTNSTSTPTADLGWMKHTSCPPAPLRIPPGVNLMPLPSSSLTHAGRLSRVISSTEMKGN